MISQAFKKFTALSSLLFLFFVFPVFALAQAANSGTNPTPNVVDVSARDTPAPSKAIIYVCTSGAAGECTFAELIEAVKHLVSWGVTFALGFSVIVIAWAGYKFMISGANPKERTEAKNMFLKVAIGMGYILGAWLIVTLILNGLSVKPAVPKFLK